MSKSNNYVLKTRPHVCPGCQVKAEYAFRQKYLSAGTEEDAEREIWYIEARTEKAFMKEMDDRNRHSIENKQNVLYVPVYVCE